jgi:hypothetical protein
MLVKGSSAAVLLDMNGKTGKMRQKTAVQVRMKKRASEPIWGVRKS